MSTSCVSPDFTNIEAVLAECGSYASVTSGVSMQPLFRTHRDMVVIRSVTGVLKKYDVALYRVGEAYILHRIIGVDLKNKIYKIRGDNTYRVEKIPFDKVIGVLTSFNRRGKHGEVTDFGYKLYSSLWNFIYPIRWLAVYIRSTFGKIYRKLFKRK